MKPYYTIGAKELGGILIAIAVILALVFVSATREMTSAADSACACGADGISTCPHAKGIPFQSYLGFSLAIVLGGLGGFMVLNGLNYQKEVSEKRPSTWRSMSTWKEGPSPSRWTAPP